MDNIFLVYLWIRDKVYLPLPAKHLERKSAINKTTFRGPKKYVSPILHIVSLKKVREGYCEKKNLRKIQNFSF